MSHPDEPFDRRYWGEQGIEIGRWGRGCARGIQYATTGAPVASGTAGVVRKISTGRKHRGMASDTVPDSGGRHA
jgi:hypothetical protein